MKLGLDLDGTITRYPEFFSKLSHLWDDDVYIITFRYPDREVAENDLHQHNIKYTDIIFAKNEDSKAEECQKLGIDIFFDDDPYFLVHFKKNVALFMVRNEENFDYEKKQFLFTQDTGRVQEQWHQEPLGAGSYWVASNTQSLLLSVYVLNTRDKRVQFEDKIYSYNDFCKKYSNPLWMAMRVPDLPPSWSLKINENVNE